MLRRTKSRLIECGNLELPPLTETTVYVFSPALLHQQLQQRFVGFLTFQVSKVPYPSRMVPLVSLQKKVYMSILRKELPKQLALSSGTSNHQSLQNIVWKFIKLLPLACFFLVIPYALCRTAISSFLKFQISSWKNYFAYYKLQVDQTLYYSYVVIVFFWCERFA